MNLHKNQSGMMLLEVLISIVIFSIGLLGAVGLLATSTQNATNAEQRIIAAHLADDMVAQMWLRSTSQPSDANLVKDIAAWKETVSKSALPNVTGNVTLAAGVTTVSVIWKAPSKKSTDNSNRLETSLAIPIP
jgi:type IV pilus assembly protein PilV